MIKTTKLTKTLYNTNPTHSQPINLYTPSTTSSSGSICETDPSSISSSYISNIGINDDIHHIQQDESLIALIDKLKRELATVKQAKSQLATLYKVSSTVIICKICFSFLMTIIQRLCREHVFFLYIYDYKCKFPSGKM
jgi:hypothetical protein